MPVTVFTSAAGSDDDEALVVGRAKDPRSFGLTSASVSMVGVVAWPNAPL